MVALEHQQYHLVWHMTSAFQAILFVWAGSIPTRDLPAWWGRYNTFPQNPLIPLRSAERTEGPTERTDHVDGGKVGTDAADAALFWGIDVTLLYRLRT